MGHREAQALNTTLPPEQKLEVGVLAMLLDLAAVPSGEGDEDSD